MNPPEAMLGLVFFAGAFWVLRPVLAAIAKRISGEARPPAMAKEDREEILTELQQVREELGELAERMDFAERMLAKQRDADAPRIAPRGGSA